MANLNDQPVRELLAKPNHAVISTHNKDGSIHSTVVWIDAEDGAVAVNSARGRHWPGNLERDPRATVVVYEDGNPYNYVEIRGTATGTAEGQTSTSTCSPRSTSGRTSTRSVSRARSGSSS